MTIVVFCTGETVLWAGKTMFAMQQRRRRIMRRVPYLLNPEMTLPEYIRMSVLEERSS